MKSETSTLENMCELIVDCPHFTPKWTEKGSIVLRNQNIKGGILDLGNSSYTSEEDFQKRIKRAAPQFGDIVITREAPMGEVCLIPKGLKCCLGQRQVLLRPKKEVNGKYLFWALQSPFVRQQILWNEGTGSTVSNVRIPVLKNLNIPRHKGNEDQIADILSSIADKIELNRQINQILESMAQTIFKSWFVDFDPVKAKIAAIEAGEDAEGVICAAMRAISGETDDELDQMQAGQPENYTRLKSTAVLFPSTMQETELGEEPEGWMIGTLGELCDIIMGQSPPGTTYNEIGNGLPFYQGITDFGYRFPSRRVYCTAPTRFAEYGDVLLSVRAPVGSLNVAQEQCAIGRGVAALRLKGKQHGYLYYLLCATQSGWNKFEAEGTVFGSANKADVNNFKVILPLETLRNNFGSLMEPLDKQIMNNEKESCTLTTIRDALLPKLISGEIKVI